MVDQGARVFLDLKFHDIPEHRGAGRGAGSADRRLDDQRARVGRRADDAGGGARRGRGRRSGWVGRRPLVIGVTVLTSMDDADAAATSASTRPLLDQVVALAEMAQDAGLDGVVASPQETAAIRARVRRGLRRSSRPGSAARRRAPRRTIRARTMGPAEAVRAGASYIVVGRPIIAALSPRAAARLSSRNWKRGPAR